MFKRYSTEFANNLEIPYVFPETQCDSLTNCINTKCLFITLLSKNICQNTKCIALQWLDSLTRGRHCSTKIWIELLVTFKVFRPLLHALLNSAALYSSHSAEVRSAQCGCGWTLNFFIAFLDELGNFKHFETYFFLAIFGPKIANLAIWRSPVQFGQKKSPIWRYNTI